MLIALQMIQSGPDAIFIIFHIYCDRCRKMGPDDTIIMFHMYYAKYVRKWAQLTKLLCFHIYWGLNGRTWARMSDATSFMFIRPQMIESGIECQVSHISWLGSLMLENIPRYQHSLFYAYWAHIAEIRRNIRLIMAHNSNGLILMKVELELRNSDNAWSNIHKMLNFDIFFEVLNELD